MGARRLLSFADALGLLGVDSARIAALDRALGGALNLATGGASGTVLAMVSSRGRILGMGRDAVRDVGSRLGRVGSRAERTELLRAAHTVIVVVAWFQALEDAQTHLPFTLADVELTRQEQLRLVGSPDGTDATDDGLVRALLSTNVPLPSPHVSTERMAELLTEWYTVLARRFVGFLSGLSVWANLSPHEVDAATNALGSGLSRRATRDYQTLYSQLALSAPEFAFWVGQHEHQATRAEVHRSLAGIETLLADTARAVTPPVDVAAALARHHEAGLSHAILDSETAPEGIRVPTLADLYLDPDFRVGEPQGQSGPADESWWDRIEVRQDLTRYLAGALTNPAFAEAPLLVLGQPGAGKSVLTRVLAARLPAAGFLPVRVALRDVRAEDELQDQIEQAIRTATGERAHWPELVRAAGGSTPVLLLDGFDELLQTTGVHHNDFLIRVARFQRREAEQGRPVLALVTSRIAVADRARYPQGMVALRLESFRPDQIRHWLTVWNEANAPTLRPMTWQTVSRHAELAEQPLLLTMLALYDATDNGLHRDGGEPLAVTELYEELLSSFARREVGKATRDAVPDAETRARVERELQRLSLVAFALLNRRRQWVSAAELDDDLNALLDREVTEATALRTPLGAAEVALGRFFFVQRAQSVRDGRELSTYEFLHATFGEYLVIRLTVRLLTDLMAPRSSLSLGDRRVDDDLAYTLLSYAPLSSRQMLRFARELVERVMSPAERDRLAAQLIRVLGEHGYRTGEQHPAYRPAPLRTASRHGVYGSNLALMAIVLRGTTTAAELFPGASDPVTDWHRHCLLWRSAMDEEQWTDFALSLAVRRCWDAAGHRSLELRLRGEADVCPPDPLDANWMFGYPQGHEGETWQRTYWDELWHKMSVAGPTPDAIVRHVMDPVFENLGPAVTTFSGADGEAAASLAHDLLRLVLDDTSRLTGADLRSCYDRVLRGMRTMPFAFPHQYDRAVDLLLMARGRHHALLSPDVLHRLNRFLRVDLVGLVRGHTLAPEVERRLRITLDRHYPGLFDT